MADVMSPSRPTRAASVSSAGTTTSGTFSFVPRYTPRPEAAYISAAAASEHVTHRILRHENYDLLSPAASPTNDGAIFTDSALALLNAFLDSLLYNFLGKARGIHLNQLRPAIFEVLKARLGREALASADEELHGLVGDGDSDDEDGNDPNTRQNGTASDWHLESAFKRMRLRVMVFIRLGDFDDEDEDRYQDEELETPVTQSFDLGFQSSPAPVYLASVLEYLAEQTLTIAGEAAYARSKSKIKRVISENKPLETSDNEDIFVEDRDIEKIALNPILGRLWRTWLKSYRGIITGTSPGKNYARRQSFSPTRGAERSNSIIRRPSAAGMIIEERESPIQELPDPEDIPEGEPSETDIAANIPLPMTERDVDEIEVPGLAQVVYDEGEESDDDHFVDELRRPRSASFYMPGSFAAPLVTEPEEKAAAPVRPVFNRQRSNSVPVVVKPWGWMPASIRRAIRILSGDSEDDIATYAASVPLPDDEELSVMPAVKDAAIVDPPSEEDLVQKDASVVETVDDTSEAANENDTLLEPETKPVDFDQETRLPVRTDKEFDESVIPQAGLIVGASALFAGAAAALNRRGHGPNRSLDVQTREVFEPSDDGLESNRVSKDERELVAPTEATEKPEVQPTTAVITPGTVLKETPISVNEGLPPTSTTLVSKNISTPALESSPVSRDMADSSIVAPENTQTLRQTPPLNQRNKFPVATNVSSPPEKLSIVAATQRKLASLQQPASRPVDSPIKSASSFNAPSFEDRSPVSPLEQTTPTMETDHEKKVSPVREGPPKPLPMTAPNPYAMLYDDDLEPELIGVARTSNVPIHSPTPSIPSEQRPWTPNRGAASVTKANTATEPTTMTTMEKPSSFSDRGRPLPSPLRPKGENEALGTAPKPLTLQAERFQSWDRPKESPTIPRFFMQQQQASTPTESEPRRGSIAHSVSSNRHSPKGSQGSTGKQDKREEEAAKERKFEALLNKNEPMKYTLTPEEIRDATPYPQNSERKVPAPIDTNRASKAMPASTKSPSLFRKSQPPPSPKRPLKIKDIREAISALSPEPMEQKQQLRRSGLTARDARVYGGETKDFVDWIRTTGPTSERQVQPLVLSPNHRWSQTNSISSIRTKSNMVAREPDIRGQTSQDLIDFIRGGPGTGDPSGRPNGNARGPKAAGVRSTVDSDGLPSTAKGTAQHSLLSQPSVTDSFNSNSPLINTNKQLPAIGAARAPPGGMPERTRRRKKDPYAIDSDDEDEDLFAPVGDNKTSSGPQTENLQDFLRSTSPSVGANGPFPTSRANGTTSPSSNTPSNFRTQGNGIARAAATRAATEAHLANGNGTTPAPSSVIGRQAPAIAPAKPRFNKPEARAAGASKGFNGRGYYYSTNDMADFLRSSDPDSMAGGKRAPSANGTHASQDSVSSNLGRSNSSSKRSRAAFWKRGVEAGV